MTDNKRFVDDEIESVVDQSFTDTLTDKTYWIDDGLGDIVNLLNNLYDENEQLKNDRLGYYLNDTLVKDIKTLLFVLAFCEFPKTNRLSIDEFSAIARLQGFLCEDIIDLEELKKELEE